MNKQIYQERRTYLHYDAGRFMLYLNEKREEYMQFGRCAQLFSIFFKRTFSDAGNGLFL